MLYKSYFLLMNRSSCLATAIQKWIIVVTFWTLPPPLPELPYISIPFQLACTIFSKFGSVCRRLLTFEKVQNIFFVSVLSNYSANNNGSTSKINIRWDCLGAELGKWKEWSYSLFDIGISLRILWNSIAPKSKQADWYHWKIWKCVHQAQKR